MMPKRNKKPWKTAGGFTNWFEFMITMGGSDIGIKKKKK